MSRVSWATQTRVEICIVWHVLRKWNWWKWMLWQRRTRIHTDTVFKPRAASEAWLAIMDAHPVCAWCRCLTDVRMYLRSLHINGFHKVLPWCSVLHNFVNMYESNQYSFPAHIGCWNLTACCNVICLSYSVAITDAIFFSITVGFHGECPWRMSIISSR